MSRTTAEHITATSKTRMIPATLLLAMLVACVVLPAPASASFATGGVGRYVGAVDWIDASPPGATIPIGGAATYQTTTSLGGAPFVLSCSIANVAGAALTTRASGVFTGDALDDMYNIGGTGGSNTLVDALAVGGATATFDFSCGATLDGNPFQLDGLVFADAEASDSGSGEFVQGTIASTATWRIIDRYRDPDAPTCTAGTPVTRTDDGTNNTLRMLGTAPRCATGPAAVAFADGATSGTISLHGGGTSAVALGAVVTTDGSDAPASYGEAAHVLQYPFAGGDPPGDAGGLTTASVFDPFVLASTTQPVPRLGPSVDPGGSPSADAQGDDNVTSGGAFGADDDETDDPPASISVTPGSTYTETGVACTGPGTVVGWIDFNANGIFDGPEGSGAQSCTGASVDLTWNVPTDVKTQAQSFQRLRIATDPVDSSEPEGLAADGEVEDHALAIAAQIDLGIEKSAPAVVNPGASFDWTIDVENLSTGASGGYSVSDVLPAAITSATTGTPGCTVVAKTLSCTEPTLAAGGHFLITVTAVAPATFATPLPNTATVTGTDTDPNTLNNTSTSATSTAGSTDLVMSKTAEPSPAVPGQEMTYTLKVTNNGPTFASSVSISDPLPAGLTFVSASPGCTFAAGTVTCLRATLVNGASATFDVVVAVAVSLRTPIVNTATVTSPDHDPDLTNNGSSVTVPVEPAADLSIAKSASPSPAPAGQNVTYTMAVTNHGPSDATAVSASDAFPAGLTLVSASPGCANASGVITCKLATLASGTTATFTIVAAVAPSASGSLVNVASVTSADPDPDPKNNTTTVTTPVLALPRPPAADLEVVKIANHTSVDLGKPITWTIATTNRGPDAATGAVLIDQPSLPVTFTRATSTQGTCTKVAPVRCALGTIAPGATVTVTLTGIAKTAGALRNTARVSSDAADPQQANNAATAATDVRGGALELTKKPDKRSVHAGGRIRYVIRVTNPGTGSAQQTRVCDRLPSGLVYVSSAPKAKRSDGRYCWDVGTLAPKASKRLRITTRVLRGAKGKRRNAATATARGKRARTAVSPAVNVLAADVRGGGVTG